MSHVHSAPRKQQREPRFYSVAEVAAMLGVSSMTVYRAISGGQFPAIKMRGRLIVPAQAVERMIEAATADGALVDPASWAADPASWLR